MENEKSEHYTSKKNPDGTDVYCPLTSDSQAKAELADADDSCVEKDVVERYSGNIDIQNQDQTD